MGPLYDRSLMDSNNNSSSGRDRSGVLSMEARISHKSVYSGKDEIFTVDRGGIDGRHVPNKLHKPHRWLLLF